MVGSEIDGGDGIQGKRLLGPHLWDVVFWLESLEERQLTKQPHFGLLGFSKWEMRREGGRR